MVSKRTRIGKFFVRRKANGQFMKWTAIGKSLKADRRRKLRKKVKHGQGDRGDTK